MLPSTIPHGIIGIDMDSTSFDWYLSMPGDYKDQWGRCLTTRDGLSEFSQLLNDLGNPPVALEGFHGQNLVLEIWLRNHNTTFYSIPPFNVARFREAHISHNKNNKNDARAVASFTFHQFIQGTAERFHHHYTPDYSLRPLTRRHHQLSALITSEYSNLWKYIKLASPDLYIALKGKHPDFTFSSSALHSMGLLHLLSASPDISTWSSYSEDNLIALMGGKRFVGRSSLITTLKSISSGSSPVSIGLQETLRQIASNLIKFKQDRKHIAHILDSISSSNPLIAALRNERGLGPIIASSIVSEIITIIRFKNDDCLASYAGLGRTENKSGSSTSMRPTFTYNRYLKDAIFTAAIQHVIKNPDSHLTAYYKNKLAQGHSSFYARRSLARALIRRIFRILKEADHSSSV